MAVQKGDVQDATGQILLVRREIDSTTHELVRSDQSGVGLVAQVGRDKEGSHWALSRCAWEDHQIVEGKIGGNEFHNQGR